MNPNKKILNPKNNQAQASPWLLCPSKSFPGKFYYFNGSTGETAWCLSETDKNLKKGPIHRVTDKAHTYPEPFEPPDDSPTTTNSFTSLKHPCNTDFIHNTHRPSPMFGQAVFPKYVPPDIFAQKFVWTLTPMYMSSQIPQRQMLDQITQTYEPEPMFVHPVPINRFQPLKRPFMPAQSSTPFHCKEPTYAKPQMKDEACQTFVPRAERLGTKSESDSTPKSALKASRSVENLTLFNKDVETSTLSPSNKLENINDRLKELDKNDLRFKLVAKKKKECTVVAEKAGKLTDQSKASKTQEGLPKKKVTFDFQEAGTSHAEPEDLHVNVQSPDSSRLEERPHWYVVSDTETLLSELQCIEEFVKSDPSCRLLIPHAVYTELESHSRGDSGAVSARQLLRRLAAHDNHIIVQSRPEYDLPTEDSILECCWSLQQEDYHVILVTNNKNISKKANSIHVEYYTIQEIRMQNEADSVPQNERDNEKSVVVENYTKKAENLFIQDLKQLNGLCLTKPNHITDKLINLTRPKSLKTVLNSEITNVNNQIIKLSITENSPGMNRTKKIINNVFNEMNQDTMTFGPEKSNINVKNNVDNIDRNHKSRPKNIEIIDDINLGIRRINTIAHHQEDSRDIIKVSGITKLNQQFNLNDEFQRFYVKNSVMENRITDRLDEWVCRLIQTMEEALTDLLLKEKIRYKRMTPPWNMFEALQVTGETYKKHTNVKDVITQFSMTLLSSSTNKGKIKKDIKPNDFMKLVGFSVILIEHLKEIVNCKELFEANERLNELIKNIEDPKTDIDLSLEKVNTPIFSRSDSSDSKSPTGFRKNRTEIIEYLRKHFEAWQSEADMTETIDKIDNKPNILITCGKNLNTLKINNTRVITLEKNTENVINTQSNNEKNAEQVNVNNQPKVIRNVNIIEAFEERIKNRAKLDLDELNYEDNESVYNISDVTEIKREKPDSSVRSCILEDLSVSETSTDSECVRAYPLVKIFLAKVKGTLLRIFKFIKNYIHEYQKGIPMDKKADMKFKFELSRQYLLKISERLKNIIERESGKGIPLKHILIKAGDYVEEDVVMANYTETITKFLRQTQMLVEILEHMLPLFNAVSPKDSDLTYCTSNIPSPILPTRLRSTQIHIE